MNMARKSVAAVAPRSRGRKKETLSPNTETTDRALRELLNRLKSTVDPVEIRQLSEQIERIIFHKQFTNA